MKSAVNQYRHFLACAGAVLFFSAITSDVAAWPKFKRAKDMTSESGTPKEMETVGQRWEQKLQRGMAMLIVASPRRPMDERSYNYVFGQSQMSTDAEWHGENGVAASFSYLELFNSSYSDEIYQVVLLPAGTYHMSHFNAALRNAQFNEQLAQKQPKAEKVGTVDFRQGSYTAMGSRTVWREPTYDNIKNDRFVCAYVIAGTTNCVSGGYVRENYTVLNTPGHYAQELEHGGGGALTARISLRQPFASITLAPGDVVLTDGIAARLPNYGYSANACLPAAAGTVRCELDSFGAEVFPADAAKFRSKPLRMTEQSVGSVMRAEGLPFDPSKRFGAEYGMMALVLDSAVSKSMQAVLSRAQYRPLTINAPVTTHNQATYGGPVYVMSK